jgi:hypothetical protein
VGAWFFDLLENIAIVSLLTAYPAQPAALATLAMVFGTGKWLFAFASIGLVLFGLARAALNGFRKQT